MIELAREDRSNSLRRAGAQPIALAAVSLLVMLAAVVGIGFWRAYAGSPPEPNRTFAAREFDDRAMIARQFQERAAQASAQLLDKTNGLEANQKGLETTQQETIDQLQTAQDQLQQVRKSLAAQQADSKRLSDQVASLTEAVEGLRQSFASAQAAAAEPDRPVTRHRHRVFHARAHARAAAKPKE